MKGIVIFLSNDSIRRKIKHLISALIFLVILGTVFLVTTFLLRDNASERNRLLGIKKEAPLDMVYVGGSATYVYWQPLKAWNDCGFTSYNYAHKSMVAESIKYSIQDVLKVQHPDLFVVDLRSFQYWDYPILPKGVRSYSNAIDYSPNRFQFISEYLSKHTIDETEDILSYYFDIALYHTNLDSLSKPDNWQLIWNKGQSLDKGWKVGGIYQYLEQPEGFLTEDRVPLQPECLEILEDLLLYCKEEKLKVLFVVCPYMITKTDQGKYNTIQDRIEAYGFDYLNTNEYYAEMGIDFKRDFYNISHVNCYGSEKYTAFLEKYIDEKYNLKDHRLEETYQTWNEEYLEFANRVRDTKLEIDEAIKFVEQGKDIAADIQSTQNIGEWLFLTNDSRFSLVIAGQGIELEKITISEKNILEKWGIIFSTSNKDVIRIYSGENLFYSNESNGINVYESIPDDLLSGIKVTVEDGTTSIQYEDEEFRYNTKGLHVMVIDNNYRKVIDTISIAVNKQGKLELTR